MAVKNYGADPATHHYVINIASTANLSPVPRALYCETSGNVGIVDSGNTHVTYIVTAGQVLPFRAIAVNANTTANVVAWY